MEVTRSALGFKIRWLCTVGYTLFCCSSTVLGGGVKRVIHTFFIPIASEPRDFLKSESHESRGQNPHSVVCMSKKSYQVFDEPPEVDAKGMRSVRPVRVFQALLAQFLRKDTENSLEMRIGYFFREPELLAQAMVHRSWIVGRELEYWQTNERLEFLGDSVLNLLITEYLFKQFPKESEGDLSKKKGAVVSGRALAECAREWGIGAYIRVGRGEAKGGGRDKDSLLADAFESVIGAVFLDGGIDPCRKILEKTLIPRIPHILLDDDFINFKSLLLEGLQSQGLGMPEYRLLEELGPEHQKMFHMEVYIQGELRGVGVGASKKRAEQDAAKQAMECVNTV